MNPIELSLTKLRELQEQFYASYPPPYEFPTDAGRIAQVISDAINTIIVIERKSKIAID
jgi:hypothetical protein